MRNPRTVEDLISNITVKIDKQLEKRDNLTNIDWVNEQRCKIDDKIMELQSELDILLSAKQNLNGSEELG